MRRIDQKHIMKLYEVYESDHSVYLIMDLINGGELLNRLKDCKNFSQHDLAKLMYNMLEALKHLHSKGVMHRDLKPENILLRNKLDIHEIILADFGLSAFTNKPPNEIFFKRCGTPGFVAPEILVYKEGQGDFYDEKCDVFSAGIIFFILYNFSLGNVGMFCCKID